MKEKTTKRLKEGCGDAVAEIIISLIFLAIGAAVLALFGIGIDAEWLDGDLIILIGIGAIFIPAGIIFAIVDIARKRKKKNIKKIEIYNKNKENDLDDTERKEQDDV